MALTAAQNKQVNAAKKTLSQISTGLSSLKGSAKTAFEKSSASDALGNTLNSAIASISKMSSGGGKTTNTTGGDVLTSVNTKPTTQITLPQTSALPGLSDIFDMNNAALGGGAYNTSTKQFDINQNGQSTQNDSFNTLVQYLNSNQQAYNDMPTAQERLDANQKLYAKQQKAVNSLQSQINTITSNRDAAILSLEGQGRGQTSSFLGGEQARISREAAIQALPLQAQLAAAQDDLDSARTYAAQLFQAQSQDAQAKLQYQKEVNATIYQYLTDEQKRIAAANEKQADREYATVQGNRGMLENLVMTAIDNNQASKIGAITSIDPASPTFLQDYARIASTINRYIPASAGGSGASEQLYSGLSSSTATAVRSLVGKYSSEPMVQNFATIQDGYNFSQSLSDTTQNPADDQALIYSLAKALDPGSVVREGEYATAQKYAQSWISSFGKGVEQALAGTGFLSETARKNIKQVIKTRYEASKSSYSNLNSQYSDRISTLTGRGDGANFLIDYATPITETKPEDATAQLDVILNNGGTANSTTQASSNSFWSDFIDAIKFW